MFQKGVTVKMRIKEIDFEKTGPEKTENILSNLSKGKSVEISNLSPLKARDLINKYQNREFFTNNKTAEDEVHSDFTHPKYLIKVTRRNYQNA
jgi:hypothetical protein